MQSNRILGLLLIVVVLVAGIIGWQMTRPEALPPSPSVDKATQESPGAVDAEDATSAGDGDAESSSGEVTRREAAPTVDPAASDLPSIVGQVVSPTGNGEAGVEIVCLPGFDLGDNLRDLDLGDSAPFDPRAIFERFGVKASDRVKTLTDADGYFRVRTVGESKMVRLSVKARGHLLIDRRVQRPTTEDTDVGVLTLETCAIITGRVVDHTGKSVVGARVRRGDPEEANPMAGLNIAFPGRDAMEAMRGGDSSVTDANGRFELAHLAAGEFLLRARHRDFPPAVRTGLSVAKGHRVADILITMPRSGVIRGAVLGLPADAAGLRIMATQKKQAGDDSMPGLAGMLGDASEMLDGIGFAYGERQCEIDGDGAFVLRGLNADSTYRVWVAQQGAGLAGQGLCSKRVEARTDAAAITLRYERGINVTLVVVDDKSGAPVEDMWVRDQLRGGGGIGDMLGDFTGGGSRQQSYPEGKVTVANLRPKEKQKLQLTIEAIGYGKFEQKDIVLPKDGSLDLGTVRLLPKPVHRVLVKNAYNGKPIRDARVSLASEQGGGRMPGFAAMGLRGNTTQSGRTDSEGRCTINASGAEVAELKVTRKGFAATTVMVSAPEGAEQEQVVRLIEGGTVVVTVLDPDGRPVKDANIEHLSPEGGTDNRRTDSSGVARFENLDPDLHDFRVAASRRGGDLAARLGNLGGRGSEDAGAPWQSVDVMDQETSALDLRKRPSSSLTGVVRENGVALEDATVTFKAGQAAGGNNALNEEALSGLMGMLNRGGGGSNRDKSDEEGVYMLSDLPAGNHSVSIRHKGRAMPTTMMVTLGDGENRFDIDLSMTTLVGVVKDSNGDPVVGAAVSASIKRDGGSDEMRQVGQMMAGIMGGAGIAGTKLTTNGQGEFELRGVAADVPLEVRVSAKALCPITVEQIVGLGQTKGPIELTLRPAGRIEITVQTSQLFAAAQAKFVGDGADGVDPVSAVLRGKEGALEGLQPGTWEVTFMAMGNRNADSAPKQTVDVVAGQTTAVTF